MEACAFAVPQYKNNNLNFATGLEKPCENVWLHAYTFITRISLDIQVEKIMKKSCTRGLMVLGLEEVSCEGGQSKDYFVTPVLHVFIHYILDTIQHLMKSRLVVAAPRADTQRAQSLYNYQGVKLTVLHKHTHSVGI